jgi:DNA-binding PadR family transcriptional regulator
MERHHILSDLELGALLAVVRLGGEGSYGITIHDDIVERTGRGVSVAAVYAALSRLEDRGLLRSWASEPLPERGGRSRRHFAVTPAGTLALAEAKRIRDRLWDGVDLAGDGSVGGSG